MSVINQMLKDLDNKNQPNEEVEQKLSYPKVEIIEAKPWLENPVFRGVLAAIIILAVAGFSWYLSLVTNANNPVSSPARAKVAMPDPLLAHNDVSVQDIDPNINQGKPLQAVEVQPTSSQITPSQISANHDDKTISTKTAKPINAGSNKTETKSTANPKAVIPVDLPAGSAEEEGLPENNRVINTTTVESANLASRSESQPAADKPPKPLSIKLSTKTPEELAIKAYQKGSDALMRGRFSLAENEFRKALGLNPHLHEARAQWASLLYGQNNPQQALKVLDHGIKLHPDHTGYRMLAARIWLKLNDYASALNILSHHLPSTRVNEFYQLKAATAQQAKNWPLALDSWQWLLINQQPQGKWLLGAAIALDNLQKHKEAEKHYLQALKLSGLSRASQEYALQRLQALKVK